jgi:hypothetical protein
MRFQDAVFMRLFGEVRTSAFSLIVLDNDVRELGRVALGLE